MVTTVEDLRKFVTLLVPSNVKNYHQRFLLYYIRIVFENKKRGKKKKNKKTNQTSSGHM